MPACVVVVVVVVIVESVVGMHACMGDAAYVSNSYTPPHHHRGKHEQHGGDAPQRRGSSVAVLYDSFWRAFWSITDERDQITKRTVHPWIGLDEIFRLPLSNRW